MGSSFIAFDFMDPIELANLRKEYTREKLSKSSVAADPIEQFTIWMHEALNAQLIEPTAMTLSTVDDGCRPSSRVVLLKGFDNRGFTFFTNYQSKKARDLAVSPVAALLFFWPELERQVIISGTTSKISQEESEGYFITRPFESRISALASNQSTVIASREELENRFAELREKHSDGNVPLPPFWGGFRVAPERFEFWQGRPSRLHDRICYELRGELWEIFRLSP